VARQVSKPVIWLDDVEDAMQLGAKGIYPNPPEDEL
tara:strand:- start:2230 stop:2337 length:108 start_codon:yes stop_codon:yes gene_type:complete